MGWGFAPAHPSPKQDLAERAAGGGRGAAPAPARCRCSASHAPQSRRAEAPARLGRGDGAGAVCGAAAEVQKQHLWPDRGMLWRGAGHWHCPWQPDSRRGAEQQLASTSPTPSP